MKTLPASHRAVKALTTTAAAAAALALALSSVHVATAQNNTFTGDNAGASITTGTNNTADGFDALRFDTTGVQNTALGSLALRHNIAGSNNTAAGHGALYLNKASYNTALGAVALRNNTTGAINVAVGYAALYENTTGNFNTALGYAALLASQTGSLNTALGVQALRRNDSGASNVAVGYQALYSNISGGFNTAVGDGALLKSTGTGNIGIGEDGGVNLTAGNDNIYIGNPGGTAGGGAAIESGIIRIGTAGTHTDTYLAGILHGDGSRLTGVATAAAGAPTNVFPAFGMVWIQPGTFLMGSPASEQGRGSDETQHAVTLTKGFYMGVHEVTQAECLAVIGSNPSTFTGDTNRPVEEVNWNDAVAYCTKLTTTERTAGRIPAGWGYRLPTEAEWEYCCRAGARTTRFGYGDDLGGTALGNYAWYSANAGGTTHPVEQKLGNPWGLMDMHGNVWEWCQDWAGAYPDGSVTDPQGPGTGIYRVLRGGSWYDTAKNCRSACHAYIPPSDRGLSIGFRVVLAPGQP